jgi:hypothetical protein
MARKISSERGFTTCACGVRCDLAATVLERVREGSPLADVAPVHLYYVFVGAAGMLLSQAAECRRLTGIDPTASPALVEAHANALVRLFAAGRHTTPA